MVSSTEMVGQFEVREIGESVMNVSNQKMTRKCDCLGGQAFSNHRFGEAENDCGWVRSGFRESAVGEISAPTMKVASCKLAFLGLASF